MAAVVFSGGSVPVIRRRTREDAMRKLRKNSQADRVRNTTWKLDDRRLDNELRKLEKDQARTDRMLHRQKFGLTMELKEMKKDVEEAKNVRNESCVVVGDGSLVRLNKQRIRERRLSLPVNLVARPSSGVSLMSEGTTSSIASRPGSHRPFRPPMDDDDGSDSDESEYRRRLYFETSRGGRQSLGEMTPNDVKLNFMKRNSIKDIGDFPRVRTPGAGPEFEQQTGPRSRLALRRQSMPDIQRARTALLLGTTPHLEPVGETDDPTKDPRFKSLMGSLTKQFDGLDTKSQRQKLNAANRPNTAWPSSTSTSGGSRMYSGKLRTTEIVPPYRTNRRMSSAF